MHVCLVMFDFVTPWTDCGPPGSSIHGILQARTLEWVAVPFSRRKGQNIAATRQGLLRVQEDPPALVDSMPALLSTGPSHYLLHNLPLPVSGPPRTMPSAGNTSPHLGQVHAPCPNLNSSGRASSPGPQPGINPCSSQAFPASSAGDP